MTLKTMRSGAALGLCALLLAACGPKTGVVTPDPDALTAPAAPTAGQATEVQNIPAVLDRASGTMVSLLNPASPDFDPDLATLVGVLGVGGSLVPNAASGVLGLGQGLAGALGGRGGVHALTSPVPILAQNALPTGTYTVDAAGGVSYSTQPSTGLVKKDLGRGTTLTVDWHVGGAATVWADMPQAGGLVRQEVPTRASAAFTQGTTRLAAAALSLTPGACLGTVGPEALSLNAWAGREANAPAALGLDYAWTASGITLKASARYRTRTYSTAAALDLDLRGTTANRCTPAMMSFTPSRADLKASVEVPGDAAQATLNLRKLSGLVISGAELGAASPFARVTGDLSASVTHNGLPMLTAFGPLADGADTDLLPGDAVAVRYVENGELVETNLAAALKKLFP